MHGKQVCASSAEEMHGDKELGRDRQLSQFELLLAQALSMSLETDNLPIGPAQVPAGVV